MAVLIRADAAPFLSPRSCCPESQLRVRPATVSVCSHRRNAASRVMRRHPWNDAYLRFQPRAFAWFAHHCGCSYANDSVKLSQMQASEAKLLKTFGRAIRSARKRAGLSQEDLAEAAKLSRNYISDIERGVRNPGLLALVGLSRALRLPLRDMLEDVEPKAST